MTLTANAAIWFLPFVLPIAIWVAWSDMKWMKIHNAAVIALVLVYAVIGLIALPLNIWAWGWLSLVIVLVIGFVLSSVGLFGAGDAKFAAAMAPFVALGDLSLFLMLLGAVILGSFVLHRTVRKMPIVTGALDGWESWHRPEFPMGLALGPSLLFYIALASAFGSST